MFGRLGSFNLLFNTKLKMVANMDDYISILESHFLRMAAIDSVASNPMKVVILMSLLSEALEYAGTTALIHTMPDDQAT